MRHIRLILPVLLAIPVAIVLMGAGEPSTPEEIDLLRKKAEKTMRDGNIKEACDLYQKLALDPGDNPVLVGNDLNQAIACLNQLNRANENDSFREKVVNVHSNNWRLLYAAAQSYFNDQHYGTIIAGEFQRGPHRGGDGKWVNSFERDRARALQLMVLAMGIGEAQVESLPALAGNNPPPLFVDVADLHGRNDEYARLGRVLRRLPRRKVPGSGMKR